MSAVHSFSSASCAGLFSSSRTFLEMAKMVSKVAAQKNQVIGLRNKIVGSPLDINIACRKLSSKSGPRIKAIRKGGAGIDDRYIKKPSHPITNITPTSNKVLLIA